MVQVLCAGLEAEAQQTLVASEVSRQTALLHTLREQAQAAEGELAVAQAERAAAQGQLRLVQAELTGVCEQLALAEAAVGAAEADTCRAAEQQWVSRQVRGSAGLLDAVRWAVLSRMLEIQKQTSS